MFILMQFFIKVTLTKRIKPAVYQHFITFNIEQQHCHVIFKNVLYPRGKLFPKRNSDFSFLTLIAQCKQPLSVHSQYSQKLSHIVCDLVCVPVIQHTVLRFLYLVTCTIFFWLLNITLLFCFRYYQSLHMTDI